MHFSCYSHSSVTEHNFSCYCHSSVTEDTGKRRHHNTRIPRHIHIQSQIRKMVERRTHTLLYSFHGNYTQRDIQPMPTYIPQQLYISALPTDLHQASGCDEILPRCDGPRQEGEVVKGRRDTEISPQLHLIPANRHLNWNSTF